MNKKLLEFLVCPICRGTLTYKKQKKELWCKADKLAYKIDNDVPIMKIDCARRLTLEELDNG